MKNRVSSLGQENIIAEVYTSDLLTLNNLINWIKENKRICKVKILERINTKNEVRALLLVTAKLEGGISEILINNGAFYVSENIYEGLENWFIVIDDKTFKEALAKLKEVTYTLKYRELENNLLSARNSLTSKEKEIIYKAYKLGYFNWPKEIDLEDLANQLGISKTATLQTLRRAMNKLVKTYVKENNL
ncbi:XRE family transcriptional regulator [Sulfolobus sp. A20]|nr:XRE family transcriptional regulator [Sulfolobus sp. A20]